jgi:hypothetical protein
MCNDGIPESLVWQPGQHRGLHIGSYQIAAFITEYRAHQGEKGLTQEELAEIFS